MKMEMFSVYDLVTEVYQPPLYAHNSGDAMRIIQNYLRQENNISLYPENFVLFKLGSFEDTSGLLEPLTPPQQIVPITDLVKKE